MANIQLNWLRSVGRTVSKTIEIINRPWQEPRLKDRSISRSVSYKPRPYQAKL